jgi:hypothetical protein
MTDQPDPLEVALAAALAERDPVPPDVVEAARAAFTWRTVDEELAALAFDSASDAELAGVRGDGPRALTFEADDVVIDVEVREDASGCHVHGQVAAPPGTSTAVEVHTPQATMPVHVDALGRFHGAAVPPGPVRLRCSFPDRAERRPITTEWVVI